jgi:hypothetical protein
MEGKVDCRIYKGTDGKYIHIEFPNRKHFGDILTLTPDKFLDLTTMMRRFAEQM